jgi:putative oxidoreductase
VISVGHLTPTHRRPTHDQIFHYRKEGHVNLALLVLRVVVGTLFVGHGAQKLFGWFGGHGPDGTGRFFESAGLTRGRAMAILAGASELIGGLLFACGLVTPAGAALLSAVMIVAIWTVHRPNGIWITENGYEYSLVLLAVLFAVTAAGAGDWSLDGLWNLDVAGEGWALAQLAAGMLGAGVAMAASRLSAHRPRGHGRAAPAGGS